MNNILRFEFLLIVMFWFISASAQKIIIGDINNDKEVNISDVTEMVNIILGKSQPKIISISSDDSYKVDNRSIVGIWRTVEGKMLNFKEDGTTDAGTYSFIPEKGYLIIMKTDGTIHSLYNVLNKTKDLILLNPISTDDELHYYASSLFITAIKISDTDLSLKTGETFQLSTTIEPSNAIQPTITWCSSNSSVADVSQSGMITAKQGGEVTITATSTDGTDINATCKVNVIQLATSVTLAYSNLVVGKNSHFTIDATVLPSNTMDKSLTWNSSNITSLLPLGNGMFYAKAAGSSTITTTTQDGSGKNAACQITVLPITPTDISLSLSSVSVDPNTITQLSTTVLPYEASPVSIMWTSSDESIATVDQTGKVTAGTKAGKTIIKASVIGLDALFASAIITVLPEQEIVHKYVDLDLPSGTLWATMNVGANAPEEYGGYYAWGETKAYGEEDTSNSHNYSYNGNSSYKKTYYHWSTYKWCNDSYGNSLTKYNTRSSYGTVDNKKVLELADDAAYVNWGENWRMPTREEWNELIGYCTWESTIINGVYGKKVSSSNGNYIFLPSSGYLNGNSFYRGNTWRNGYYWSSSIDDSPYIAWFMRFSQDNYYGCGRKDGYTVRPVRRQ